LFRRPEWARYYQCGDSPTDGSEGARGAWTLPKYVVMMSRLSAREGMIRGGYKVPDRQAGSGQTRVHRRLWHTLTNDRN